ncbi:SemiSWEET transporter [Nanoarchaeota archaeon]
MDPFIILGLFAGTLTTVSFVPQVIKTWKTKQTNDISLLMYSILCLGILSWLIYGLFTNDIPIIAANTVAFILALTILVFKIKYR